MNLLIIGNGLDLDLKLPTKYSDFLRFSEAFIFFLSQDIDDVDEFNIYIHNVIDNRYKKPNTETLLTLYDELKPILSRFDKSFSHKFINKICKDFYYCVHRNCWIEYFKKRYKENLIAGENWIDIETEIQYVIQFLENRKIFEIVNDQNQASMSTYNLFTPDSLNIQEIKNILSHGQVTLWKKDYEKLKNFLITDFDKFVMALGIYLDFFVSQLQPKIEKASNELQDIMLCKNSAPIIDYVLSFNYINNFKSNSQNPQPKCCFVHGEINYMAELEKHISEDMSNDDKTAMEIENIISRNKIIIGFDDLHNDEENFELEFVDYRKYFQRIYKGTDSQYVDWLNEYQEQLKKQNISSFSNESKEDILYKLISQKAKSKPNQVFIFGHSLDSTDNEIFKDIFLRELNDTKVTIYYHDVDARKRIITNLIKILTKPILIQKTKGKNPDIKFIEQTYNSSVL